MVKLEDIAARLNISIAAVSRALRNDDKISQKTRNAVKRAAKEMGYIKSVAAARLAGGKTNNIAFIFNQKNRSRPYFADEVYSKLFQGLEEMAVETGYHLFVRVLKNESEEALLFDHQISGILYAGYFSDIMMGALKRRNIPFVCAGSGPANGQDIDIVSLDVAKGSEDAIDYFVGMGHCRIGLINSDEKTMATSDIESGYKSAHLRHKLKLKRDYMLKSCNPEDSYDAMVKLMQLSKAPTAVLLYNDKMTLAAYQAVRELGLTIPDDVSIIGQFNTELLQYCRPKPVMIDYNVFEAGRRALLHLVDKIERRSEPNAKVLLPPRITEGDSVLKIG